MTEGRGGSMVRVVRCPKCEKLLPEIADFTVYSCGGCGATLQVKREDGTIDSSSFNNDEEKVKKHDIPEKICTDISGFRLEDPGVVENLTLNSENITNGGGQNSKLDKESKVGGTRKDEKIVNLYFQSSEALDGELNHGVTELVKENIHDNNTQASSEARPQGLNGVRRDKCTLSGMAVEAVRMENARCSSHPDEVPSNYQPKSNVDAYGRVENLEQDRAELLKKLDDLNEQLRRSCEVSDKPNNEQPLPYKSAVSFGPFRNHSYGSWFPQGSSSLLNRAFSQHSPYPDGHGLDVPNLYSAIPCKSEVPLHQEMALCHPIAPFPQGPQNTYLYNHLEPNQVINYHHEGFYHQHACSCLHCYNRHCPPLVQGSTPFLANHPRSRCLLDNRAIPLETPSVFGHQNRNRAVGRKSGQPCQPIAGAAPFVICHNCSKLLQLPPKLLLGRKNRWKLRCGSCSELIFFEVDGNRIRVAAQDLSSNFHTNICDNTAIYNATTYSGEYDSPSYEANSTDEKPILPCFSNSSQELLECGLNSSDSEKRRGLSSSSSTSEGAESRDNIISEGYVARHSDSPCLEGENGLHAQGVRLHEYFRYQSSNHVISGPGKGSRSRRCDQEKIVTINGNFRKNSLKDVPVSIEMDLSSDDYPNPSFSQDSTEANKDNDPPRGKGGGDSFLAGFIKKSFKDLRFNNQSVENGRSKVSVNGHHISDQLVKKAEKQAGPIHPGEYWYDYRAGFWGVMGHPCLGIVLPFIEEFNYPMSRSCAGGDTRVLVNGRELHCNDLDLLSSRGLPKTPGQSYIIEISGKVWDEVTGEELESLGKLAPTVERVKHGFGMFLPGTSI